MIRERSFYTSILRLSLPSAFQAVMSLMVVMADNVMVASLDSAGNSLAAVSASNSITNFVNASIGGLASGAIVLVAQYWGRQDKKAIRSVYAVAFSACLLFSLLAAALVLAFRVSFIGLVIGHMEPEARRLAGEYLPIIALSWLPFGLTAAAIASLKGVEVVRVTLYTTMVSLISNISLNYILIFGKLGLPALGVRGAAIATLLARTIEMALALYYLFKVQTALPIKPSELTQHHSWAWRDYARYGLPVALADAQWALVGMLKMVIIGQLGRMMINATTVAEMLFNLGTLFTFSLAGGASVLVGKAVGENDMPKLHRYSHTIQLMFLTIGIVMAGLVFLMRRPFVSLYQVDVQTAALALKMIAICVPTLIGTSYHASCFIGINRGAGDNRFVMMIDMICGWLIVLPSMALGAFVLHLPLHWVYFLSRVDQSFKWIIARWRLTTDKWIHHVTRDLPRAKGAEIHVD